jgi:hypothetical protein
MSKPQERIRRPGNALANVESPLVHHWISQLEQDNERLHTRLKEAEAERDYWVQSSGNWETLYKQERLKR